MFLSNFSVRRPVATIVLILSIIPVWLAQRLSSDPVGATGAR